MDPQSVFVKKQKHFCLKKCLFFWYKINKKNLFMVPSLNRNMIIVLDEIFLFLASISSVNFTQQDNSYF